MNERPSASGRQIAFGVVAALLIGVGVAMLIARAAGFSEVRHALEEADPVWFTVSFLAVVVSLWGYAALYREAFRWDNGPEPGIGLSALVMLAGIGGTRIVAGGAAGALAVSYWCFRRARFATREALVRVLGFNTLFYVLFGVGAWVAALLAVIGVLGEAPLSLTLPWLILMPACFAAAHFVTQPVRVDRLARTEGSLVRRGFGYAIAGTAWAREVLTRPQGARALGASAVYWTASVACLWAALHSVGESLPPAELALAFATGQAAMILPLPLGGVGGVDAAMTYALTAVGVPLAPALVAVAVYRLFSFWLPTVPALVALAFLPRTGRSLERVALRGCLLQTLKAGSD